jgi:hypothetical protein
MAGGPTCRKRKNLSIIFHQITSQNNGFLPLKLGTGAPFGAIASQGLLVNELGEVYATTALPPVVWSAGLPFDSNGRLVVEAGSVATFSGGLGFTASGALAVTDGAGPTPAWFSFAELLINFEQGNDVATVQDLSPNDSTIVELFIDPVDPNESLSIINTTLMNGGKCAMMRLDTSNGYRATNVLYANTGKLPLDTISLEFTFMPQNVSGTGIEFFRIFSGGYWPQTIEVAYRGPSAGTGWTILLYALAEIEVPVTQGEKYLISVIWQSGGCTIYVNGQVVFYDPAIPVVPYEEGRVSLGGAGDSQGTVETSLIDDIILLNGYALRTGPFTPETDGILGGFVALQPTPLAPVITNYNQGVAQMPSGSLGVTGLAPPVIPLPGQVTGVVLQVGINALQVTWNAVVANPTVTSYTVEWQAVGATAWQSTVVPAAQTTYVISALNASVSYAVRVAATSVAGTGAYSTVQTMQPEYPDPTAVTGFAATPQVNALDLVWNANPPLQSISAYTVFWSLVSPEVWQSQQYTGTSATLTGLVGGAQYTLWITATNPKAVGPFDINLLATPLTAAPGIVDNLSALTGPGVSEISVFWDALTASPAVTSYIVRWRVPGAPSWDSLNVGNVTSTAINGFAQGVLYELSVAAVNSLGTGAFAPAVTAIAGTSASTMAIFTSFSTALKQAYRMDVTPWAAIDSAPGLTGNTMQGIAYSKPANLLAFGGNGVGNRLQVYDTSVWPFVKLTGITQPSADVIELEFSNDGQYLGVATYSGAPSLVYKVVDWSARALDTATNSAISFNFDGTRVALASAPGGNGPLQVWDITVPAPVVLPPFTGAPTNQVFSVSFHPSQNLLAVNGVFFLGKIFNLATNALVGTAPGLTGNFGYTLKFNHTGNRLAVSTSTMFRVFNTTLATDPANYPNVPITNPPSVADDNNLAIAFSAMDNYMLARNMSSPDQSLAFDMTGAIIVRVSDFDQVRIGPLQQATFLNNAALPQLAGQVQNLVLTPGVTILDFAWDLVPGTNPVTGYIVQWRPSSQSYFTNVAIGVTNRHTLTGLTAGVTYFGRVVAVNSGGWGAPSTTQSGVPTAAQPPTQVLNVTLTSGNTQFGATWTAVVSTPAVTAYSLEYKTALAASWTVVTLGNVVTTTVTGLPNGEQQFVRVRAQNSAGFGPYSATVTITPLATPLAPTTWTAMTRNLGSGATGAETIRAYGYGSNVWMAIFAGGYASRSLDDGSTWAVATRYLNSGAPANTTGNQIRSDGGQVWVALFDNGYAARSVNGGVTWAALPRGLGNAANPSYYQLKTDGTGVWIAAGASGYASRSVDNGATWTALPQGLNMGANVTIGGLGFNGQGYWIAYGDTQYASRSGDSGATWTALTRGLGTGVITANARGVIGLNNIFVAVTTGGYASRSVDLGATWTALPRGLNTGATVVDLHIGTDKQSTLVCVTGQGWASQSTDRGATWTALTRGLNTGQTTLDFECVEGKGNNSGIFMSGQAQGYASRSAGATPTANIPGVIATSGGAFTNGQAKTFPTLATAQINTPQLRIQNANANSITISISFNGSNYTNQVINPNQLATFNFASITNGASPVLTITANSTGVSLGQIDLLSL